MSEPRTTVGKRTQWSDEVIKRGRYPSLVGYLERSSTEREMHRL